MTKENLKTKLLEKLGEQYSPYIDQVIDIISVVISENYFTYEQLVKYLKEKSDIEQEIGDQPKYIPTDRGKGVKVNPVYRELQRVEKEIVRLSKSIAKTKTKKQKEAEKEVPFDPTDEEDCRVALLIYLMQFINKEEEFNDIEKRRKHFVYPQLKANPLYDESKDLDYHFSIACPPTPKLLHDYWFFTREKNGSFNVKDGVITCTCLISKSEEIITKSKELEEILISGKEKIKYLKLYRDAFDNPHSRYVTLEFKDWLDDEECVLEKEDIERLKKLMNER